LQAHLSKKDRSQLLWPFDRGWLFVFVWSESAEKGAMDGSLDRVMWCTTEHGEMA